MSEIVLFPEKECPLDLCLSDSMARNGSKIARDIDTHILFETFQMFDKTDESIIKTVIEFYKDYKLAE